MPWTAEDAERHTKKADSPKRQRMWAEIANSVLADTGDEGRAISRGQCSGRQRLCALIGLPRELRKRDDMCRI